MSSGAGTCESRREEGGSSVRLEVECDHHGILGDSALGVR